MALNARALIEQKNALEAQLKALNESIESQKGVIENYEKAYAEIEKIKVKFKLSDEDFIELLNSFNKPKLVWVKVGDKAEEWPESKRGRLSFPEKPVIELAGLKKYSDYIKKFKITAEEAAKLNG